ncbi:MAG TPA: TldD/PmbA family protein [Gemmatimonadales bacterium]|nr:TldD/PmbA family protein [Gemmatimonadales bacterium]
MKSRIQDALGRSRAGYTELRLRRVWSTSVLVRDRTVEVATAAVETGGIVRSCSPGTGWGMMGFSEADRLDLPVTQAHELSLAAASRIPVALAPIAVRECESAAPLGDDPREIPLTEKRQRAESLAASLFGLDRRVVAGRVLLRDEVVETWLATSEGTWVHDLRSEVSVAALAIAEEEGNIERALGSLGLRGGWRAAEGAERLITDIAARAVDRLHATPVRPGRYTVVLDPAAAGALVHRAIAHLARPALPGADPDVLPLGTRIGPECLSVGDDPTAEGLRATTVCDDEGTGARRTPIVQNGVVVGHLHSRETAAAAGQAPTGHARAGALRGAPHPRATNTYLAQGTGSFEDLIGGIGTGLYIADTLAEEAAGDQVGLRAGSARLIRGGRLGEPVKGVHIGAAMLSLLGRIDAVAADFAWDAQSATCRDGSAGVVAVTAGAPHVRLVDVAVGEEFS